MANLLLQHAIANLWCEPIQDKQYTLGLARLTKAGGVSRTTDLHRGTLRLPNYYSGTRDYYHLYQIGKIPSSLFNWNIQKESWILLTDLSFIDNTTLDLFLETGVKTPLNQAYVFLREDGNLLLAAQITPLSRTGVNRLEAFRLFLRIYNNAWFDNPLWRANTKDPLHGIRYLYRTIVSHNDFLDYLSEVNTVKAFYGTEGRGLTFVNGFLAPFPITYDASLIGSTLGFYWDTSIKEISMQKLSDLPVFRSQLDINQDKYAFIRSTGFSTIDYQDDVDFYLYSTVDLNSGKGVYVGRQRPEEVRQITHSAYALHKVDIDTLRARHPILAGSDCSLVAIVRRGGMIRGLTPDRYRLDALYSLPFEEVRKALTDSLYNNTIPEWHLVNLENSAYNKVVSADLEEITQPLTEEAYGYNAMSQVLYPPHFIPTVVGSQRYITVTPPYCLPDDVNGQGRRSFFAYQDGFLQGWFNNNSLHETVLLTGGLNQSDLVEAFVLRASATDTGNIYGENVVESKDLAQYGFRCYICPLVGGIPTEDWTDVTESEYYTYTLNGTNGIPEISWNTGYLSSGNFFPCVRIGGIMSIRAPEITLDDSGILDYVVTEDGAWTGTPGDKPLNLAPGVVDVFLDGKSLIRNVDYYMQWPRIVICHRPNVSDDPAQLLIRFYGWSKPESMTPDLYRERSYVKEGVLSLNCRYDIRNDRNSRIVVGGLLKHRSQVRFAEENGGSLTIDGRPYSISDYAFAIEPLSDRSTVPFRQEAINLDERVMDYLTARLPLPQPLHPTIFGDKWTLYSPFSAKLIHEFIHGGFLSGGELDTAYTDEDIETWITPYKYLLNYDPAVKNTQTQYVTVLAHAFLDPVTLTAKQYSFMDRIAVLYLKNLVDMTPSVKIGL